MEVKWAKFTRFFLRDKAVFKKSATFNGVVHVDARFKVPSSSTSDVDRQTDRETN